MARPFLTAAWRHLAIVTYLVPPALLAPRLPRGLTLDLVEEKAAVSFVAFQFQETRVLGIQWPWHHDFSEVNLRYYVRNGAERGVVFLREFVPRPLIAWIARGVYNEPYRTAAVDHQFERDAIGVRTVTSLRWRGSTSRLVVEADDIPFVPDPQSREHFFKEQTWGYGTRRNGETLRYRVEHPIWEVYPVRGVQIDVSWGELYGESWSLLHDLQPHSVVLAAGSEVSVYSHRPLS